MIFVVQFILTHSFKVPLGSVKGVSSSLQSTLHSSADNSTFNVIIDSGCIRHMFPNRVSLISYKPCSHSFIILADKSKAACLGSGTISIILGGRHIILHDVSHVPSLRCPLISVHCIRRLKGWCFLSDNSGCFLTFPTFFLPVDDSSACIIQGHFANSSFTPIFASRLVGVVSAVSHNTRHQSLRRPVVTLS
jgi:hypothetical protein